ncbi:hypothetical protein VTO42DRAFT_1893 [Malbranchea cinnamomea]
MKESSKASVGDWPGYHGFDTTYEERSPIELEVTGEIPPWVAGVFYRTGIGPREIKSDNGVFKVNHWFDALAVVHRFQILPPDERHPQTRVVYNSRSTCDKLIEHIQKTGSRDSMTFGRKYEPCTSLFKKAKSVFKPSTVPGEDSPEARSMSITLSVNYPGLDGKGMRKKGAHDRGIQTLCNKSDMTALQMIDPETLEPIGLATQAVLHPDLKGPFSAAHARSDPVTGDIFNYNLTVGRSPTYRVFRVSASTGETSILATIQADASYIHSLFLTDNYVILCVWNAFYVAGGIKIIWHRNLVDAMADYDASRPARWYVIDRRGDGGLVATYESPAFFCFHSINAFEESSTSGSGTDIVADLVAYDNLDILKEFYLDNLLPNPDGTPKPSRKPTFQISLRRYRLPLIPAKRTDAQLKAQVEFESEPSLAVELPTLNPLYVNRRHRYVYGVINSGNGGFLDGLMKVDMDTKQAIRWSHSGQYSSEAIFVPRPGAAEEDDGVLLSAVLDGYRGVSYLLVLDAKTLTEIARAETRGAIGFGFHGVHVSSLKERNLTVNL